MKEIGSNTYGHDGIKIIGGYDEGTKLIIGKFCSIAEGVVVFLGANHRVDWFTTYPFGHIHENKFPKVKRNHGHPASKGNVVIGNDVWIATNAVIMSGIKIGDGAIIGAYSIVTKDVPPYTIVAGNPAKQIRKRFSDEIINKLLELKWWDMDETRINEISDILCSNDIEKLNNI
jgi:acetyltransferase-like isoleucine patch superfamily enzyme